MVLGVESLGQGLVQHVGKRGKEVLLSYEGVGDNGANVALPINEEGNACASLKETVLPSSVASVHVVLTNEFASLIVVSVVKYRTIVAGEDDDGVLQESFFFQLADDLPHTPVGFDDDIAPWSHGGRTYELAVGDARHVRFVKSVIEEEGLVGRLIVDERADTIEQVLSHILVTPQGRTSASHEADARNAVDDCVVVAVRRSDLRHEFWVGDGRGQAFEILLITDLDGVGGIETHDVAVLDIDARHAVDCGGKDARIVEPNLVGTRFDMVVPIDMSLPDA